MLKRRCVIVIGAGLLAWLGMGPDISRAADIFPVFTPDAPVNTRTFPYTQIASPVSIALFQGTADVTDSLLPEPGVSFQIKVKVGGMILSPTPSITLRPPAAPTFDGITNPFLKAGTLTTTAYPGQCGNCDNPAGVDALAPDVEQSGGGDTLTLGDYAAIAVIDVLIPSSVEGAPSGTYTFAINDGKFGGTNGIWDPWETTFCPATLPCPTGAEDNDPPPVTSTTFGDGHGALDEFRGFKVRGIHRRFHPGQKEVVISQENPQCVTGDPLASGLSRLGGGTLTFPTDGTAPATTLTPSASSGAVSFTAGGAAFVPADVGREILVLGADGSVIGRATITGVTGATGVNAEITQAIPASVTFPIASGSWRLTSLYDNLANLFGASQVYLLHMPGQPNRGTTEWRDNFVSYSWTGGIVLTSGGEANDRQYNWNAVLSGNRIVRGLRNIECVDANTPEPKPTSPLGMASRGLGLGGGYAILFSERIIQHLNNLISAGGSRKLKVSTFVNGAWTPPVFVGDGAPTNEVNKNLLKSIAFRFYKAHEDGHAGVLTKEVITDRRTTYGYHYPDFTGDELDRSITCKLDKSTSGFNTCYIPSIFNTADKADFKAR